MNSRDAIHDVRVRIAQCVSGNDKKLCARYNASVYCNRRGIGEKAPAGISFSQTIKAGLLS